MAPPALFMVVNLHALPALRTPPEGFWSLAKVMGACIAFSGRFNQFSISHRVPLTVGSLALQKPDQIAGRRASRFRLAPSGQGIEGLGAPVAENANAAPQEHGIAGHQEGRGPGHGPRIE